MNTKCAMVLVAFSLCYFLNGVENSLIKPNNIPRVGRSNEDINPFDQGIMGYVIKTNKNIPRMGRRNYDSENRYDIPKFYQLPSEGYKMYEVEQQEYSDIPIETYSSQQFANMKR